jgi:hypothetical protein
MPYVKRIICLANSFKIGGSCIAGREVLENGRYGGWIRPVSARPTAEVLPSECKYENAEPPKLLDVIDVPLLNPTPHNHQTENHVIDPNIRWSKKGAFPWAELEQLEEHPGSLWINRDSTTTGAFDCISPAEAGTLRNSLLLIRQKTLAIAVGSKTWAGRTKRTHRADFKYNGADYSLGLTDPVAIKAFEAKDGGKYQLDDVFLCVSLTEPYEKDNNRCHKLVAAIMKNPPL